MAAEAVEAVHLPAVCFNTAVKRLAALPHGPARQSGDYRHDESARHVPRDSAVQGETGDMIQRQEHASVG